MTPTNSEETVIRSVCRICHGGCGALIHVRDNRVVRVTGDPNSPMSKSWMCVKGANSAAIANHPDRLRTPLRKIKGGKSEQPRWEAISWEVALDEITARLQKIRSEFGPESVALGQGTGRHHYMHVVRFANALGTPNWYEPGLAQCFIPRITACNLTYGGFVTADYYGDTSPGCILFWGNNPLVSSPDGKLAVAVKRALDAGAMGLAVDPCRTETAQRCAHWLPIRPGTDAALALAMIHHIISASLYDRDFVYTWTTGFEELAAHVQDNTPAWAAKITGIPTEQIKEAARLYATIKPAILDWGVGLEQNTNSFQTVRALACLRAITGNIDVPGGDILGMNLLRSYPTLTETLPKGMAAKRLGAETFKLLGGWRSFMPSAHIPTLFRAMRTGEPYPVKALLIFGNNPLTTLANSHRIHESLKALDLLVVTDLFMTPTAEMADYVLPAAFWTEVDQVIGYPLVVENMVYAQQKAVQTGDCRQDEWIMDQLSKRLHLPGCDQNLDDVMAHQLAPLALSRQQLLEQVVVQEPHRYHKYLDKGFRTPSKKIELYCKSLARMGYEPLPVFHEPPESPVSRADLSRQFPFILITGGRRRPFFHSEHRQVQPLRRLHPDPLVTIHPQLAVRQGLSAGDWAIVSSPRGSIRMRVAITEDIRPDVVSVEHGWWFPEKPGPEHGIWESNANILTNDEPPYDPAFGTYQLRGMLCAIVKENNHETPLTHLSIDAIAGGNINV